MIRHKALSQPMIGHKALSQPMIGNQKSAYEEVREANIARNDTFLKALGIESVNSEICSSPRGENKGPKRKRRSEQTPTPTRVSARRQPVPESLDDLVDRKPIPADTASSECSDKDMIRSGHKVLEEDGTVRWCGECFGDVAGYPVGTVFGSGDLQRLGRKTMTESGFFVPFVQPEWLQPKGACYALILNNDNGSSVDHGESFIYVGSGGRLRGQNRTAPLSFHQSWDNTTNAALKLSWELQVPVRVVRGPKLNSGYRPQGGGFRYDGLYLCEAAYMEPNPRGLKQCHFVFRRVAGQPPLPTGGGADNVDKSMSAASFNEER